MASTNETVTVASYVSVPVDRVWEYWTNPEHIKQWNNASPDWHTPKAENDLRNGGKFSARMEAKDGSFGFDFGGTYDEVKKNELIRYTMGDGRKVEVKFTPNGAVTLIEENFDAEQTNPVEMQRTGWQAILDNFKKYAEEMMVKGER
jgi:uncharacterized protein YndB with AHSA1/START domain